MKYSVALPFALLICLSGQAQENLSCPEIAIHKKVSLWKTKKKRVM